MPSAKEILDALTLIANEGKSVALVWHVLMFVAAVVFRNSFNVALLALSTLALLALALRAERQRVSRGPGTRTS